MDRTALRGFRSGLVINLASNFIAFLVGAIVTYFTHEGSGWIRPVLYGAFAWLITFCSILSWRNMKALPVGDERVTSENVERKLRDWLDKFSLTVKSIREPGSDFYFIVTTDGEKKITISRASAHPFNDSLLVKAVWSPAGQDKKLIDALSEDDRTSLRLAVNLELSRAVVGYKIEGDDLIIFKRVPISSSLKEADVFNAIWEIEAVLGSIFTVGAMVIHRHNIANKEPKS